MTTQIAVPLTAGTAPPASVRAARSRPAQTIVLSSLGLLSGVLLMWQLGSVDLVGSLADARPGWLAVAVAASPVPSERRATHCERSFPSPSRA